MPRLDTRALLEERAQALQRYFGKRSAYLEGKIDFPSAPYSCSVSYVSRRSIMSTNYYLSLAADLPCAEAEGPTGTCFLNRLGKWKLKGKGSKVVIGSVAVRLRSDENIEALTRKTDLDSVVLTAGSGILSVRVNLYGGGFSAIMLPPIRFKVGISPEQLAKGARLLHSLVELARPACGAVSESQCVRS
jgi:hypothetical protein